MDEGPKGQEAALEESTAWDMTDGPVAAAGQADAPTQTPVPTSTAPAADPWEIYEQAQAARAEAVSKSRKKHALVASGVAVVVIAAGIVGGVVASKGSGAPGSGMAPAAFVVSATQTTLAQRTADMTYSGSISVDGQNVPINATGEIDFDTNSFTATLNETVKSTTVQVRELIAEGQFYMGMSLGEQDMSQLTGGAHWVSISLPNQSSSIGLGATNVDPVGQLKALEAKGATVTTLGTKAIDGTTVSGFSVTPSRQEVESQIEQEIQQNQISAATAQQMLQAPDVLGKFTTDVWIDGSGLVRQEDVNIAGGSAGITAKATIAFQNYGTPVSITAPAPSDVIPFSQFLNDLQSLESSQGT